MTGDRQPRRIKSVDRAFDVLETLRDRDGATVTEVANRIGLSSGTVHTYLATMEERGYVRAEDGEYRLGLFLVPFGEYIRTHSSLYRAGKPVLDALAAETNEVAHLVVETHGHEIPLYEQFGSDAVGERLYAENKGVPKRNLHCSAAGKAILAHVGTERREEILAEYALTERTPETISDETSLREELEAVKEQSVAFNDQEQIPGLRAVGTPVTFEGGVRGAVSLSAPTSRLQENRFRETFPDHVRQAANIIEVNLQSFDDP